MKNSTKSSLIIFIVTLLVGYVMTLFIPDEVLAYATINGSILSFLGDGVAKVIGMRAIIAVSIAIVVVLLIRIVDTEEKNEKEETAKKTTATKTTKKATTAKTTARKTTTAKKTTNSTKKESK